MDLSSHHVSHKHTHTHLCRDATGILQRPAVHTLSLPKILSHTHTQAHAHRHRHTHTHTHTHAHAHINTHTHTHIHKLRADCVK